METGRVATEMKYFVFHLITHISWVTSLPLVTQPRLSIVDWGNHNYFEPQGPGTYAFGYDIEDPETNNVQFRDEERYPNGTVVGSYGFVKPDGNIHVVKYVADGNGYRATVEDSSGQPKVSGFPIQSQRNEGKPSQILLAALNSQKAYGQAVHEQRLRPISENKQPFTEFQNYIFPEKKNMNDGRNNVEHNWLFENEPNYYVEPQKYYIRRE
ncbi:hypothetical protein JTB14_015543 [Gonioctena quinquepunctata]|nr:hypothetical protein JTB14_015543 [Gonioctena quinquepunctata]